MSKVNENRKGYKETKVGWIPEDWEVVRFNEAFDSIGGTALEKHFSEGAKYKVVSIGNYSKGGKYIDNGQRIVLNDKTTEKLLNKGDLVMVLNDKTLSGEIIGASILIDCDNCYIYNQRSQRVIPLEGIDSVFAWFYLNGPFRKQVFSISQGGTQIYVNFSSIKKQFVALPPISEQKKIAEILSAWDEGVERVEKLIEKKKELKKGLMLVLLTGKVRFKEFVKSNRFVDTKIGKVPEDWGLVNLSKLGKVVSGGTPSTENGDYWNGDINWCTPTDITALNGRKYLSNCSRRITKKGLEKSSATLLPENSLVVCTRATIGDSAINTRPFATNQGFKSIISNKEANVEYLYYYITFIKHLLVRFSSGSTFLELSKKDFNKLPIRKSNIEEQRRIAEVLSEQDSEIELLQDELDKLKLEKKGLMQKLLTGEVRVKV